MTIPEIIETIMDEVIIMFQKTRGMDMDMGAILTMFLVSLILVPLFISNRRQQMHLQMHYLWLQTLIILVLVIIKHIFYNKLKNPIEVTKIADGYAAMLLTVNQFISMICIAVKQPLMQ